MTASMVKAEDIIGLYAMLQKTKKRYSWWTANPDVPPEVVAFVSALSDDKVWAEYCKLK